MMEEKKDLISYRYTPYLNLPKSTQLALGNMLTAIGKREFHMVEFLLPLCATRGSGGEGNKTIP